MQDFSNLVSQSPFHIGTLVLEEAMQGDEESRLVDGALETWLWWRGRWRLFQPEHEEECRATPSTPTSTRRYALHLYQLYCTMEIRSITTIPFLTCYRCSCSYWPHPDVHYISEVLKGHHSHFLISRTGMPSRSDSSIQSNQLPAWEGTERARLYRRKRTTDFSWNTKKNLGFTKFVNVLSLHNVL